MDSKSTETLDVLIVGAGFGGLYLLYTLRNLGSSVKVHESGGDLGGIWYWNRFPGARVDSPSPIYQFSFPELWKDWKWTERYASAQEIRNYFQYVDEKLDLTRDVVFNSHIAEADFDETHDHWVSRTSTGNVVHSRFLLLCTGIGAKPYTPNIEGLDTFKGICHHSSRWPDDANLTNKRVGVIGTGATGVQIIQELAPRVSHLTVFQRTPNYALRMDQAPIPDESQDQVKELYPHMLARREQTSWGFTWDITPKKTFDATKEERILYFEELWEKGGFQYWLGTYYDMYTDKKMNDEAYSFWRKKVRARIHDPIIQEKLAPMVPPHPFGVKRCSLELNYYETFNRSNVSLVDLKATPIKSIVPTGVLTSDEVVHELDAIILATGYDAVTGGITQIDIRGTDGVLIRDKWANGVYTYLGNATAKYPNMFFVYGPQAPTSFCNGPTCVEIQGEWLAKLLVHMRDKQLTRVEATRKAEEDWRKFVNDIADQALWHEAESWYTGANIPGKATESLNFTGGLGLYRKRCQECVEGGYKGFEFSPSESSPPRCNIV